LKQDRGAEVVRRARPISDERFRDASRAANDAATRQTPVPLASLRDERRRLGRVNAARAAAALSSRGWCSSQITVTQWNAHSLDTAKAVGMLGGTVTPDVILLSEVWTSDADTVRIFDDKGYSLVFGLRPAHTRAGGVAIAFKKDRFLHTPLDSGTCGPKDRTGRPDLQLEYLVLRLISRHGDAADITVAAIYYPPECLKDDFRINRLLQRQDIDFMGGDWNAQSPSWDGINAPVDHSSTRGNRLDPLFDSNGWQVCAPADSTCFSKNKEIVSSSTVDFLLVRSNGAVKQVAKTWTTPHGLSDHAPVHHVLFTDFVPLAVVDSDDAASLNTRSLPVDWHKLSPDQLVAVTAELDVGFNRWLAQYAVQRLPLSSDTIYNALEGIMYSVMDKLPRIRRGRRTSQLPRELETARVESIAAWRDYANYVRIHPAAGGAALLAKAQQVAQDFRSACERYSKKLCVADISKTQLEETSAWHTFSRLTRDVTPNAPLKAADDPNRKLTTDREKAEAFLPMFQAKQLLTPEQKVEDARLLKLAQDEAAAAGTTIPTPEWEKQGPLAGLPPFTFDEVSASIRQHDVSKCPDLHAFDARMLRLFPASGVEALRVLFDTCLKYGKIPSRWRDSVLAPLYKSGKPTDELASFRPVAITSWLCRTYERCMYKRMTERITLSPEQLGFRAGSSTVHSLLLMNLFIQDSQLYNQTMAKEKERQFRVIEMGLDFTDAFCRVRARDVVEMYMTLRREQGGAADDPIDIGITRMIYDFMSKRRIAVRYGSHQTGFVHLDIGVGQGSVLGSCRWTLACEKFLRSIRPKLETLTSEQVGFYKAPGGNNTKNTTPEVRKRFTSFFFYADDSAILAAGRHVLGLIDAMQHMTEPIRTQAAALGLKISAKSTVSFYRSKYMEDEAAALRQTVDVNAAVKLPINSTEPHRMLGVLFDPAMTFTAHIDKLVANASRQLCVIRKCLPVLSPATARALYVGKVLSTLLYAVEIWGPCISDTNWERLERIHVAGARIITGCLASTRSAAVLAEAGLRPLQTEAKARALDFVHLLLRRPDDCPVKKRYLHAPDGNKRYGNTGNAGKTLRDWCADVPNTLPAGQYREPYAVFQDPIILAQNTSAAKNVRFDVDRGLGGAKEDHSPEELLAANLKMYAEIEQDIERLELLADGSLTNDNGVNRTGAAAILYHVKDGVRTKLGEFSMACGAKSCIFTAESHALKGGLGLVLGQLQYASLPLHVIQDSLSCIQRLARGPCDQKETMALEQWKLLLDIAVARPVTFHFAFSHCGWNLHDEVDESAKSAAFSGNLAPPIWWKDESRHHTSKLYRESDAAVLRDNAGSWRFQHCDSMTSTPLRIPYNEAKTIHRLRCGVERTIGGWRKGAQHIDSCRNCGAHLSRDKVNGFPSGVEHFFACPSMKEARTLCLGSDEVSGSVLFDKKISPDNILRYWKIYTGQTQLDAASTNGSDDSDDDDLPPGPAPEGDGFGGNDSAVAAPTGGAGGAGHPGQTPNTNGAARGAPSANEALELAVGSHQRRPDLMGGPTGFNLHSLTDFVNTKPDNSHILSLLNNNNNNFSIVVCPCDPTALA
jgi:hypothetical protein